MQNGDSIKNQRISIDNHLTILYNQITAKMIRGEAMSTTFPGTTIEVSKIEKGCSRQLFDGIFATGGITLSQVSIMTGLEPYIIQNWVKRGFVEPPKKRVYSRGQFARAVIINMLKEALKLEDICSLIHAIGGDTPDTSDDLILDEELYHSYVDLLSKDGINLSDPASVMAAATAAAEEIVERIPDSRKKLSQILQVMLYAHSASRLRVCAEDMLGALK